MVAAHTNNIKTSRFAEATCPLCFTHFDRLPVEGDYIALPVTPCADDACGQLLCVDCAQFACDGCGQTFCQEHQILVPDGTPRPLRCCQACAAECEELPARIPAQSETRPAIHTTEVA